MTNVLAFGLPGTGKTHAARALGHALVSAGHSVLFVPAYEPVQELLVAKRDLRLPRALRKLDAFELLVLDDIGYVQQSAEETEVLFTLMAERYERRSVLITSNLVFSEWERIFKNPMTTAAAIDGLVHHSVILEFDVPRYRTEKAKKNQATKPRMALSNQEAPLSRSTKRVAMRPGLLTPKRTAARSPQTSIHMAHSGKNSCRSEEEIVDVAHHLVPSRSGDRSNVAAHRQHMTDFPGRLRGALLPDGPTAVPVEQPAMGSCAWNTPNSRAPRGEWSLAVIAGAWDSPRGEVVQRPMRRVTGWRQPRTDVDVEAVTWQSHVVRNYWKQLK
jgi:hypothetical protein